MIFISVISIFYLLWGRLIGPQKTELLNDKRRVLATSVAVHVLDSAFIGQVTENVPDFILARSVISRSYPIRSIFSKVKNVPGSICGNDRAREYEKAEDLLASIFINLFVCSCPLLG